MRIPELYLRDSQSEAFNLIAALVAHRNVRAEGQVEAIRQTLDVWAEARERFDFGRIAGYRANSKAAKEFAATLESSREHHGHVPWATGPFRRQELYADLFRALRRRSENAPRS